MDNNFTLYHERNVGFGASFVTVLCLIDYCIEHNIKAFFDIRNVGYSDISENNWDLVFEQPLTNKKPSMVISSDFPFSELVNFGEKYWKLNYDSKEREKFCDSRFISHYKNICKEYITIKKDVIDVVENYLKSYNGKKILGVHKRNKDHLTTGHARNQEHLLTFDHIFSIIDEVIDDYDYLFLMSDEYYNYETFLEKYNNKLIFFDNKSKYKDVVNALNYVTENIEEKHNLLKNLISEILILSKCDKMLLMNSNVSHMSLLFANHNDYKFYDNHLTYS
jgi:hypothetical protein